MEADQIVSKPYEVDPLTIDRTYSKCSFAGACKAVKNIPNEMQFTTCVQCQDKNVK